jgi:hypothetical protein
VIVALEPWGPAHPEGAVPSDLAAPKGKEEVGEIPHVIGVVVGVEHPI